MNGKTYVQIVCVKETELSNYKGSWPQLSFFELPASATALGIGASRHWMLKLARKICAEDFPYFFMLDDNVQAWKGQRIVGTAERPYTDTYFDTLGYPAAQSKSSKMKDLPLSFVLQHFQHDSFREELARFGIIGFDREGFKGDPQSAYARRHVYKAIIINIGVIVDADYAAKVHVWEDLSFNLRIS